MGELVGSLERATELLRAMASEPDGVRLRDLALQTGLPASTAHRLLATLEGLGLANRRGADKRYRFGDSFLALCSQARRQWSLDALARPTLGLLSRRCGATSYLSIISGLDAVCVLRVEGGNELRAVTLQEGTRRPLGIGAGSMALLAALEDAEIDRIIAANALPARDGGAAAHFAHDPDAIRAGVASTRARGYASHSGQLVRGVEGLGVAANLGGLDVGISISFIGELTSAEQRRDYLDHLRDAASTISAGRG